MSAVGEVSADQEYLSVMTDLDNDEDAAAQARKRRIVQRAAAATKRVCYDDSMRVSEDDQDDGDYEDEDEGQQEETKSSSGSDSDAAAPRKPSIRGIKKQARYEPGVPMTKAQLAAWRKEARRVRNRESAAASRQKTRSRIQELEEQVAVLQAERDAALQRVAQLEEQEASGKSSSDERSHLWKSSSATFVPPPSLVVVHDEPLHPTIHSPPTAVKNKITTGDAAGATWTTTSTTTKEPEEWNLFSTMDSFHHRATAPPAYLDDASSSEDGTAMTERSTTETSSADGSTDDDKNLDNGSSVEDDLALFLEDADLTFDVLPHGGFDPSIADLADLCA